MYVRLAFAVAAHLEPEILVVDEVLAVGDAAFQNKCLGKMGEVASGGRTVLFVSHNITAIQSLCSRAIWLQAGRLVDQGEAGRILRAYSQNRGVDSTSSKYLGSSIAPGLVLRKIQWGPIEPKSGESLRITLVLESSHTRRFQDLCIIIYSGLESRVAVLDFRPRDRTEESIVCDGVLEVECCIQTLPLVEGDYSIGLYGASGESVFNLTDLACLTVHPNMDGQSFVPYPAQYRGVLQLDYAFETRSRNAIQSDERSSSTI
jgi:lipopolysaccharide transport system ATP-binding protein